MGNLEKRLVSQILECAQTLWAQPPSAEYVRRVAFQLAETGAVESDYRNRRQESFRLDEVRGAWGFWQTELGACLDSLRFVLARPELCARFEGFSGCDVKSLLALSDSVRDVDRLSFLHVVNQSDRLAVSLCRVHYLRMPGLIPGDTSLRAAYWKRYYNTVLGAGTEQRYLDSSFSSPIVSGLSAAISGGVVAEEVPSASSGVTGDVLFDSPSLPDKRKVRR